MQTSTSTKEITAALLGFHKDVSNIPKTATNPFFKSKYADLSTILTNINDPLIKNGLVLTQFPEGESGLTTRLMHTSGEWMESTYYMKPVKPTPQDAGSAITYQRRYAIGAILSLNIDEDDDGNKASKDDKKEDNKNGATLYNHKKIGEPGRPLISNKAFKEAMERIDKGEFDLIPKLEETYSFVPEQKSILESKKLPA